MGIRLVVLSLLPSLMLLQACDGTPFGQRLSESFDSQAGEVSPAGAKVNPNNPDPNTTSSNTTTSDNTVSDTSEVADQNVEQAEAKANDDDDVTEAEDEQRPTTAVATDRPEPKPTPERTLPYRIMIRLSAADPAAPAEGVTEALRRAGIGFEVETIEKLPVSDLNQSSKLQPKPAS
jgi:hypothetical protein